MIDVGELLVEHARRAEEPIERVCRQHLLQGVLRRWAKSPQAGDFVLRGALLTQLWCGSKRRVTRDIDFLGLFPLDRGDTHSRLKQILGTQVEPDGLRFVVDTLHGQVIWEETPFPGLRYLVQVELLGQERELQIDVGFNDPLIPAAEWIDFPALLGPPSRVQAIRPELLVAWKLHGLFEHGVRRWQAKNLFDLHLLTESLDLDRTTQAEAIRTAFASRGDPLSQVPKVIYERSWWESDRAQAKWAKFRASAEVPVPPDLVAVAQGVARELRPALEELVSISQQW